MSWLLEKLGHAWAWLRLRGREPSVSALANGELQPRAPQSFGAHCVDMERVAWDRTYGSRSRRRERKPITHSLDPKIDFARRCACGERGLHKCSIPLAPPEAGSFYSCPFCSDITHAYALPLSCSCGARCEAVPGSELVHWTQGQPDELELSARRAALELSTFANQLRARRERP